MHIRNIDRLLNKEGPIEHIVEVNIYYQGHRKRTEIDVIREQKQMVILGMLWLVCNNPEIDWRTGEVKMMRCLEECGKQWRSKQEKSGQQKSKEEEAKEEVGKKQEKRKKKKEGKMLEVKRVVEEWEIWDEKEEAAQRKR